MLAVEKIYLTHYSPLSHRKQTVTKHLLDTQVGPINWVEGEPSLKYIEKNYDKGSRWVQKLESMGTTPLIPIRLLNDAEISLLYKHVKVYEDMVKNKVSSALVLEDDVILSENFKTNFNLFCSLTPRDYDMIFIGSGCNLRIPASQLVEGRVAYKKDHPASKCTDSYVITYKSAERLLSSILPFTFPIDFELNYQMFKHEMNVYWWEPPLVKQGSQCGAYRSEIQ
jgi:hypothetical protein